MQPNLKAFFAHLQPKETRTLAESHVTQVEKDESGRVVTLLVDKLYAFNDLISHQHIDAVIKAVKKSFGQECRTVIQFAGKPSPSEREKAIPHQIHYQ
jgi:GGDEF domain-containing protein